MYDDYSEWGFGIWSGNPDLKPETSTTYEIGLDFSKGSLLAGVTYFYSVFDDYIKSGVEVSPEVYSYENVEGATISGIEGTFSLDLCAFFDLDWILKPYASFTYLTEYTDEENDIDLFYTPQWTTSYGIQFTHPGTGFFSKLN